MERYRTLGERIRYARSSVGLSQGQLAAALRPITKTKVGKSLISQWERDVIHNPNNETMLAIQAVTGFSLDWLVRGKGPERVSIPTSATTARATIDHARLARAMRAAAPDLPESLARTVGDLYDLIGDTPDISDALLDRIAATLASRQ